MPRRKFVLIDDCMTSITTEEIEELLKREKEFIERQKNFFILNVPQDHTLSPSLEEVD